MNAPADEEPREEEDQSSQDVEKGTPQHEEPRTPSPIPAEVLEKVPEPFRGTLQQIIATATYGPQPSPIARQVTPEHIGQALKMGARENELHYKDIKHARWIWLVVFLAIVGLIIYLDISGERDLVREVIRTLVLVAGGFGGGYGYSELRKRGS